MNAVCMVSMQWMSREPTTVGPPGHVIETALGKWAGVLQCVGSGCFRQVGGGRDIIFRVEWLL